MDIEKRNKDWVDFQDKIVYIYEKIFQNDKDKLIFYFSDMSQYNKRKSRKKTIENWLSGQTKKPNGFHLHKFKISEYELNGTQLFTHDAFEKWSFEKFKERLDTYLVEKDNIDIPNEMKYIYFFNRLEKRLSYFEITYPNSENPSVIYLNSPIYTTDMTYKGDISTYNNMTYITVKNQFDYMNYIFKNNVNVYRKDLKVFGVAQCVDAPTREPKAYMALLTSKKLTQEEEQKFAHKLNYTNLIIADDFSDSCRYKEEYFLENFSDKIYMLERDISHYDINESFSKDLYFDIVIKEYRAYIDLMEKSFYHNDYAIDHKRESILFALEDMCREELAEATIVYLLNAETLNILDSKNSIMEMQLKLVRTGKLSMSYIFIVPDFSLLNARVIAQIEYLEERGMNVTLTNNSYSIYSKILLVEGQDFAIYKRKNETDDNHVTKNADTIETLFYEVEELAKTALNLKDFLEANCRLMGRWYGYSYSSVFDAKTYKEVEFNIKNNSVTAKFDNTTTMGEILKTKEYTLLMLEYSLIKIYNINARDKIFRISIIGREKNMHHRDVLLFGIMSREKLSEEQALMLLDSIHKKDDESFRVKISNEFDSTLAYFDMG